MILTMSGTQHLKPRPDTAWTLELVVARCHESLAWLRRVPESIQVTVYNKGDGACGGYTLPNLGREAHSYLHHIAAHYDQLADLTVFVQGYPFDHAPDLHHFLRSLANGEQKVNKFHWLGFLADTDDAHGRRLFVPWSKNPHREELDMDTFSRRVFGAPAERQYTFFGGGQFAVSRDLIRRRSQTFYQKAAEIACSFQHAPHCFERCWDRIFSVNGTAGRLQPGEQTAYFKPIRRMGAAPPTSL